MTTHLTDLKNVLNVTTLNPPRSRKQCHSLQPTITSIQIVTLSKPSTMHLGIQQTQI